MGHKGPIFEPNIGPKFRSFAIFSKSFHWFHINIVLTTLRGVNTQRPNFKAILGPQISQNFRSSAIFSKSFHWFHISIAMHAHCKYF